MGALDIELIINTADEAALQLLRERTAGLRREGHQVRARITFEVGDATAFAREAAERGAHLVICAGGDGTVNEVVNGLLPPVGSPVPEGLPRLGIVPLGTGNDFASFIGVPPDPGEAFTLAVEGEERRSDVAVLNGRYFINVSSGGLGAEATGEASDRAKRLLGTGAYFLTAARTFGSPNPSRARFTSDGEVLFEGPFLLFAVGNGGRSGGGNWVTPRADLSDGLLELCIVGEMGRADLLRLLPELRSGDHLENQHVTYRRVPQLRVEPLGDLSANVDGEAVEAEALEYSVVKDALRLSVASA